MHSLGRHFTVPLPVLVLFIRVILSTSPSTRRWSSTILLLMSFTWLRSLQVPRKFCTSTTSSVLQFFVTLFVNKGKIMQECGQAVQEIREKKVEESSLCYISDICFFWSGRYFSILFGLCTCWLILYILLHISNNFSIHYSTQWMSSRTSNKITLRSRHLVVTYL